MPAFPIVDSHLHVWDPSLLRYPWLDGHAVLNRPFLLSDYNQATAIASVAKMVFVQCECEFSQCEREATWVSTLARKDPRMQGMVAWAPLEEANVAEVLERYSDSPLIKGIRRIIQFEADPGFCLSSNFVKGIRSLSRFRYSFDICINYLQLPQTIELVSKCQEVQFILDHVGKPDIKSGEYHKWAKDLKHLAEFDNVHCKLSGLVTEADHGKWSMEDVRLYVAHAIECFGFDRLIFGGDWPVVTQASTFERWVKSLDTILSGVSEDELRKFYCNNAVRFYKLPT